MGPATRTFFFSSRRRHTRCLSDWSSDVCSSDLVRRSGVQLRLASRKRRHVEALPCERELRSEERRVGKKCRSRWAAGAEKKDSVKALDLAELDRYEEASHDREVE